MDYIVTFEKDTIYGKIRRRFNLGNMSPNIYRFINKKEKKVILPKEVSVFYIATGILDAKKRFESISTINNKENPFFASKIIDGRIKLYKVITDQTFNSRNGIYYISKDNSTCTETDMGFSRKKSHKQVRKLVIDNEAILSELDSLKGSVFNIKNTISPVYSVKSGNCFKYYVLAHPFPFRIKLL